MGGRIIDSQYSIPQRQLCAIDTDITQTSFLKEVPRARPLRQSNPQSTDAREPSRQIPQISAIDLPPDWTRRAKSDCRLAPRHETRAGRTPLSTVAATSDEDASRFKNVQDVWRDSGSLADYVDHLGGDPAADDGIGEVMEALGQGDAREGEFGIRLRVRQERDVASDFFVGDGVV